jgi:drug/metabolite transporter (DMT)-like permease
MRNRAELGGFAALVAGASCIGFAPLWVRWSEVGPVATAFYRVGVAVPLLWCWALRERRSAALAQPAHTGWAVAAGVCFALDLAAWHLSIQFTSVANATLLANLAPAFVTLGAWIFLGERAGTRFCVGLVVALAGAALLTGASLRTDPDHLRGDLLGLLTAIFYGGYQLCVAKLRRGMGPGRVLLWSSVGSAPLLALFSAGLGEALVPQTVQGWAVLAGLAITAQVLGQGLITFGFAHLPASHSSLTLLIQPLVAALAAWRLLGEPLTLRQAAGGLVLLIGIAIARHRP